MSKLNILIALTILSGTFAGGQDLDIRVIDNMSVSPHSRFGGALAIQDSLLVAGAPGETINGNSNQGAVYIFELTDSWHYVATLTASDGQVHDFFGGSLAISGSNLVVSSIGDFGGSVYFFQKEDDVWVQRQKIRPANISPVGKFGSSLAMLGNDLIVGAWSHSLNNPDEGLLYHFALAGDVWSLTQEITPPVQSPGLKFGVDLALSDDFLAVGASGSDSGLKESGSVFLYRRFADDYHYSADIKPPVSTSFQLFGESVDLDGHQLIVGSKMYVNSAGVAVGATFIFDLESELPVLVAKLESPNAEKNDLFGHRVAIENDLAVVTALRDNHGEFTNAGSAYIFKRDGGDWLYETTITAGEHGQNHATFGNDLSLDGTELAIGAHLHSGVNENNGNVFTLELSGLITSTDEYGKETGDYQTQIYPNPFKTKTTVRFSLPRAKHVKLQVFNMAGQTIATILDEQRPAGDYIVPFDAKGIPAGAYSLKLQAGPFTDTKIMVVR